MESIIIESDKAAEQITIELPENLRGKKLRVVVTEEESIDRPLTLAEKREILAKNKGSMPAILAPQIDLEEEWYLQ
ncbi:hypothetical protein ACFSUS_03380 [Spirosoma soli]|uniref:Uncharacterized protein n=1 Tax=Spirosoma soli TaxID=1770529 RepID=A0ABW5LXZ8_9BACT